MSFISLPSPSELITFLIILMVAFPVHEFAHAWTANYFGDDTPRLNGRLTLNPFAHLDIWGTLLMLFVGFGWAKPVPVNPYLLRRRMPSAPMWVALAGPLSNLLIAVLAAIPFRLGLVSTLQAQMGGTGFLPTLPQVLGQFVSINLFLMLFNLIPLYPLDGEKVAEYLFPPAIGNFLDTIRPYSSMILLVLVFLGFTSLIIGLPHQLLFSLLVGW
jgi:Zn-dependent protease